MSEPQTDTSSQPDKQAEAKRPGLLSMLQSVAAAAFGVQSEKKREQDFQHGKAGDYIALGIVFVIVFIITLVVIVNMVLDSAAK
ncbi:MAG: DUF2970 domain-containing protein [Permianibacter sp.]